jgi:hypothetical protein
MLALALYLFAARIGSVARSNCKGNDGRPKALGIGTRGVRLMRDATSAAGLASSLVGWVDTISIVQ